MPKYRPVRVKIHRVKLVRKIIGGGVKVSYLPHHSSHPSSAKLRSGQTESPVPTPSTRFTDNANTTCNASEDETAYCEATRKELSSWESMKDEILQESYKSSAPSSNICNVCNGHAECRCVECSRTSVFCKTCVEKMHQNSLHLPEKWNKTRYEAACPQLAPHSSGDHSTHGAHSRELKMFVNTGRTSGKERTTISEEHKVLLQNSYQQGMNRVGSPLITAAAEATGLAPVVIDNWIGNYRRSLRMSSVRKGPKKKLYTRDLSAYNLFCRDLLQNNGNLQDIKQKWSSLGEAQRKKYVEEAATLKAEGRADHLSPEMRKLKLKKHMKQLRFEVSSLEMMGVDTAAIFFDHQRPNLEAFQVSSKGGAAFLDSTNTLKSFAFHFKAGSSSAAAVKEPVDALVKKVQEVFNKKYNEAGGRGSLPYQSLQNHSIIINASGLPDGLTLKKPSCYGRKQLEDLLKAAEQISFQIDVQSVEVAAQTSNTIVMTANDPESEVQPQTVEGILEAMCGNNVQSGEEPVEVATVEAGLTASEAGDLCCICHTHYNDEKKNAMKKWREWRLCSACQLWSHLACGFRKNLCSHCQHHGR